MQEHQEAMVKSLVAVAWADGKMESEETEVIDALIDTFEIGGEDAESIRSFAQEPKTLDDVPLTDLSWHDRRMLLQHAVIVTYIDGKQTDDEVEVLNQLVKKLNVPEDEAKDLLEAAASRAKKLLDLL